MKVNGVFTNPELEYTYDNAGNQLTAEDGNGHVTSCTVGNDGSSGGNNTSDGDSTRGNDGTRGGVSVVHIFPADGEYRVRMMMHSIPTGQLYGSTTRGEVQTCDAL